MQSISCGRHVRPAAWSSRPHLSEHLGRLAVVGAISLPCSLSASSHSESGGEAGPFLCLKPVSLKPTDSVSGFNNRDLKSRWFKGDRTSFLSHVQAPRKVPWYLPVSSPSSSSSLCGVALLVRGRAETPAITCNQGLDISMERGRGRKAVKEAALVTCRNGSGSYSVVLFTHYWPELSLVLSCKGAGDCGLCCVQLSAQLRLRSFVTMEEGGE